MASTASSGSSRRKTFSVYLIQPSHYDDDGYVIQWVRSEIPSNSMAMVNGIVDDCVQRRVLGPDVDIDVTIIDETNARVHPDRIVRKIGAAGGEGLVCMIGVQSNQYPRALDIARRLRAAGIQVCIGGFHVSGCLSMLPELPPEIREAQDLGISIFAGEAEGRMDQVFRDAHARELKPLYNYMNDLPGLEDATIPILPPEVVHRNLDNYSSFDCGRGCPFQCSFCTIINVQGRKSRYRSADDVERILRRNFAEGITSFFVTDDNFARNKNWEAILDRIIELREGEGIPIKLIIQVDTLCHKTPNFIEKCGRAGVTRVFIGLENINPANLAYAQKNQNRITEYRQMLLEWKAIRAITYCGYITGFPGDTRESILNDIEIIKRELPIDLLEFFFLTPLPGSQDHKTMHLKGEWMEPDLNKYDLEHACAHHPKMSRQEWEETYDAAWHSFYNEDHFRTIIKRNIALRTDKRSVYKSIVWFYGCHKFERVHPLQGGLFRRKYRKDRRIGMTLENPLVFYPKLAWGFASKAVRLLLMFRRYRNIRLEEHARPDRRQYTDLAITPVADEDRDDFELYSASDSAKIAVENEQRRKDHKSARKVTDSAELEPAADERIPEVAAE
jgi:radical SAM superfamily enzyme YgiQ (UPF0313 family)